MSNKKYNELVVVDQLRKKHDIRFHGNTILVLRGREAKCDLGIKTKGKIDFLVNFAGYVLSFTTTFN